jgi:AmmeMemoRadiSam system protein A
LQVQVLDAGAQRRALRLAREAVERQVLGQPPAPIPADLPEALRNTGACFVTLQAQGDLRGCIGRIQSSEPLYENVIQNAVSAATQDPRFHPVSADELSELSIEISVLTPPEPVAGPEAIELGRHGVILEKWSRRAVFLPQVAVDQVWTVEQMLDQLARKAGLAPGAWKEDTRFEVFSCQVFSEADAATPGTGSVH